jgi:hypothetical protein
MTRDEYEIEICACLDEGRSLPFKEVRIGDWRPIVAECHKNADTWVKATPGSKAIRGWITFAAYSDDSVGLTAHSIVEEADGRRFDITPLENESYRRGARFVAHYGDDQSFFAMKELGLEIRCLNSAPSPKLDSQASLAAWAPDGDEDGFV